MRLAVAAAWTLLMFAVAGCGGRPARETAETPRARNNSNPTVNPDPAAERVAAGDESDREDGKAEARRRFREDASDMTAAYAEQLKVALGAAIAQGGPARAITICSTMAPEIAREISSETTTIHRVGTRVRNARTNTPTSAQRDVLERLSAAAPEFVGELDGRLTYMKAIILQEAVCLNCHGPREDLAPEVVELLDDLYPDDQATGYRQGDLRGAFVVERLGDREGL